MSIQVIRTIVHPLSACVSGAEAGPGAGPVIQVGDDRKHLVVCQRMLPNNKVSHKARRYYFDHCLPFDARPLFRHALVGDRIAHALQGGKAGIFVLGAGPALCKGYERLTFFVDALRELSQLLRNSPQAVHLSYAFLGITDAKCVDLIKDRIVHATTRLDVGDWMQPVESCEEIIHKVIQGTCLPFVIAIRLDIFQDQLGTSGYLYLGDFGWPVWHEKEAAHMEWQHGQPDLTASLTVLRDIVHKLGSGTFCGDLGFDKTWLTQVLQDFMGGNGLASFVLNVQVNEQPLGLGANEALLFAEKLSSIRCLCTLQRMDQRVLYNHERGNFYHNEYQKLKDQVYSQQQSFDEEQQKLVQAKEAAESRLQALLEEIQTWKHQGLTNLDERCQIEAQLKTEKVSFQFEKSVLETETLQLKEQNRALNVALLLAKDKSQQHWEQIQHDKKHLKELQQQITSQSSEMALLKSSWESMRLDNIELEQRVAGLEKEKTRIAGDLEAGRQALELQREEDHKDLQQHAVQAKAYQKDLQQHAAQAKAYQKDLERLQAETRTLQKQLDQVQSQKEKELGKLQRDLEREREQLALLKDAVEENKRLGSLVEKLSMQIESMQTTAGALANPAVQQAKQKTSASLDQEPLATTQQGQQQAELHKLREKVKLYKQQTKEALELAANAQVEADELKQQLTTQAAAATIPSEPNPEPVVSKPPPKPRKTKALPKESPTRAATLLAVAPVKQTKRKTTQKTKPEVVAGPATPVVDTNQENHLSQSPLLAAAVTTLPLAAAELPSSPTLAKNKSSRRKSIHNALQTVNTPALPKRTPKRVAIAASPDEKVPASQKKRRLNMQKMKKALGVKTPKVNKTLLSGFEPTLAPVRPLDPLVLGFTVPKLKFT